MRLWIVWSWYEAVSLLSVLPLGNVDITFFLDRAMRPWAMKDPTIVQERITKGAEYLLGKWVDMLLVPPVYEHLLWPTLAPKIVPLFTTYLREVICPYSVVGKLGLLTNRSDLEAAEQAVREVTAHVSATQRQQRISKFHPNFPVWKKDISHRQLQLPFAGRRDRITENLIKTDLRYFKDVDVDTLVPLDRSLLYREKQIRHRMGAKMKFHGQKDISELLTGFLPSSEKQKKTIIPLQFYVTAMPGKLLESKPRKRLLEQGKTREVQIDLIENF